MIAEPLSLGADVPNDAAQTEAAVALFGEIRELVARCRQILSSDDPIVYEQTYRPVLETVAMVFSLQNANHNFINLRQRIEPNALNALKVAARLVESEPTCVDFNVLADDLQQIMREVVAAVGMDAEVRQLVIEHLNEAWLALAKFRVAGAEGLRKDVTKTCGSLVLHARDWSPEQRDDPVFQRLVKWLTGTMQTAWGTTVQTFVAEAVKGVINDGR